jgi:hypothetical protein
MEQQESKAASKEHIVRIPIEGKDDFIDFYRDTETHRISLCSKENCADLPALTGMETTELFNLLQPLGKNIEQIAKEYGIDADDGTEAED